MNTTGEVVADPADPVPGLDIEIWSDVVCPWCYIGKRKFEAGLERFRELHPEVPITISYRAFQLDPTAPPGVSQKVFDVYVKKFGGPERAQEILDRVTKEARGVGLDFDMDIAQRANTLMAHALLVLADKVGLQSELSERLMRAYFCEGEAIGDPEVLVRLAGEVGMDEVEAAVWLDDNAGAAVVAEQLEVAADLGVGSVPTFVFNRSFGIPGAQTQEYFVKVMERLAANAQLET